MQHRIISADEIFTLNGPALKKGYVVIDSEGRILDLLEQHAFDGEPSQVEYFEGAISPGMINAHCHLELSSWKDKIAPGLGLDAFINSINQGFIEKWPYDIDAMQEADLAMHQEGIVAVADISNTAHSFKLKAKSKMHYHTFAEIFAFAPEKAESAMQKGIELMRRADAFNLSASISPHAPYSLSKPLMRLIADELNYPSSFLSIHHQESKAENEMFLHAKGKMVERLKLYGISMDDWNCPHNFPAAWFLKEFENVSRVLLVHNTFSDSASVALAQSLHDRLFWCICPKANLYIEKQLPDIEMLRSQKLQICIGTDSLASNNSLSIVDEMQTIHAHFPQISFEELLQWACLNGALFLGLDDQLGSLEKGKKPGLVHWPTTTFDKNYNSEKTIRRIS
jgi:cytosine/adenosine deaminase-related metal-dependent hydrolase